MSSVSDFIEKGQGFRLAWKPTISISDDRVHVRMPASWIVVNPRDRSDPTTHPPELFISANLDNVLYLDSGAQESTRAAVLAAVRRHTRTGLGEISDQAEKRWALQADIEESARGAFERLTRGVKLDAAGQGWTGSEQRWLPVETDGITIVFKPSPRTTDECLGPLTQTHEAIPSHALFAPTMSIVSGSDGSPYKVRYTMPSLLGVDTGAGPLVGVINESLLDQMARTSVVILGRCYHRRGAAAEPETMENWLKANRESASAIVDHRIGMLLGNANASETAILPPGTCTPSLSTQRATWPLSDSDSSGAFFEIVAGPTEAAVELDRCPPWLDPRLYGR